MATVIEELVSRLGFQIDDKKLDQFNRKSEQLKTTLKRITVIATAAAGGLTAWISKVGLATDANIKFADSVGITFQTLQELQFATEREGGSLGSLQSSLLAVSQRIGEASRGMGEGVQVFGMLGVSIKDANGELKTADKLLEDISKEFQNFDRIRQIEFAQKLGISPDILLLLQKGRENLRALRNESRLYGLVNEETARNSEKFQDSLTNIRATVRALFTNIAGGLLPIITEISDKMRDWFLRNRDIINQKMTGFVKSMVRLTEFLVKNARILLIILTSIIALKLVLFFGSFAVAIAGVITGIVSLNANLTITNVLMAGLPVLVGLAIAALIALVFVWQDLKTSTEGGDSFLAQWADDSKTTQKAFEILFKTLDAIKTIIEAIIAAPFRLIKIVLELIEITKLFGEALQNSVLNTLDKIENKFKGMKEFMQTTPTIQDVSPRVGESIFDFQKRSKPQSSNQNINAEININGANSNPIEIAQAVGAVISDIARNGMSSQPEVVRV